MLRTRLERLGPDARRALVAALPGPARGALAASFGLRAHAGQVAPPDRASGAEWRTWVIMAGRGFGKTRAGAEWVLGLVRAAATEPCRAARRDAPAPAAGAGPRIALVAASIAEARAVMVEGPSGLLACARPGEVIDWSATRRTVTFAGGAVATLYSGCSPEGLRGPEHDFAWCDELAKWRHAQATWDNLQLGLRRGACPRALVTTTPRAGATLRAIAAAPDTVVTGGRTRANPHLPPAYVAAVEARYAGTRLGAQELDGVLARDVEGSLWPAALIERCRIEAVAGVDPGYARIVVGVDPPASAGGTCGIVVCAREAGGEAGGGAGGAGGWGRGVVLDDASIGGASPEQWAHAVAAAAERWGADRVVVERNQGGDMVESTLRAANATLPIRGVHAARGKAARAEPVAALFEAGRAVFAGRFAALEDQLTAMTTAGYRGAGPSPDRADAMVWAMWALLIVPPPPVPRITRV